MIRPQLTKAPTGVGEGRASPQREREREKRKQTNDDYLLAIIGVLIIFRGSSYIHPTNLLTKSYCQTLSPFVDRQLASLDVRGIERAIGLSLAVM